MKNKFTIIYIIIIILVITFSCIYPIIKEKKEINYIVTEYLDEDEKISLFGKYYDEAEKVVENMTLEEKIGQIFIARMPILDGQKIINLYNPGGYIIYGINTRDKSESELKNDISYYQMVSNIPMIITIDEEGGSVVRISGYEQYKKEAFKSQQSIYNESGILGIITDTKEKIEFLKNMGINVNMAPVVDVSTDESDYIYDRSLGKDASETAIYAKEVTNLYNKYKFGMALKHFPGYGNNTDTHLGEVVDNRSLEELKESDLIPFEEGIKSGAQCIMFSHHIVACIDDEYPASLSKKVHEFLRDELDFSGIIVTDNLNMKGITDSVSKEDALIYAVNSGNDMIITNSISTDYEIVLDAVRNGKIKEETINTAVRRIIAWKYYLGIIK